MRRRHRALIVVTILAAACGNPSATAIQHSPAGATLSPAPTLALGGPCHSILGLPDSSCTPGAVGSDVTPETTASTICTTGFTSTGRRSDGRPVRPAVSYTDHLKLLGIAAYGYADTNPADYEEDHLIPLELGGDGYAPTNLWPEPRYGTHPASEKDTVENYLNRMVCSGGLALAIAREAIAQNWETAESTQLPARPTPSAAPATVGPFIVTVTSSSYGFVAATTSPGAICRAQATLPSGRVSTATGLQISQTAASDGVVSWSYGTTSTTKAGTGTHTVTCTDQGVTISASATFTVA